MSISTDKKDFISIGFVVQKKNMLLCVKMFRHITERQKQMS